MTTVDDHLSEQERFYQAVDQRRRQLGLSWVDVCKQAGVDQDIATKLGRQRNGLWSNVFRLQAWLNKTKSGSFGIHTRERLKV